VPTLFSGFLAGDALSNLYHIPKPIKNLPNIKITLIVSKSSSDKSLQANEINLGQGA
jgi:hypothetical protein